MMEVIAAVGQPVSFDPANTPFSQATDNQSMAVRQPTAVQAGDFARTAAAHPIAEVHAMPPVATNDLSSRLARQADDLSAHLKGLDPASRTSDPAATAGLVPQEAGTENQAAAPSAATDQAKANQAVSQMERAYMFAIETTMASRGSTEATKIFNTLLKGQ